ncbi:hypothetical protein FBQ82_00410 [Anaerolineae bacterium CFX7]|nr:hypothetical protein [Anaerolineae bacterium CFX7]
MYDKTRDEFLNDLCPRVRPLIAQIIECECGCELLDVFQTRPRTMLELADVTYHVKLSQTDVVPTLELFQALAVIERREILDTTFYRLTQDAEIIAALEQFWTWRQVWHANIQEVRSALKI